MTLETEDVQGETDQVYELPQTGGMGTPPLTLGGLILMISSALMYGLRRIIHGKEEHRVPVIPVDFGTRSETHR